MPSSGGMYCRLQILGSTWVSSKALVEKQHVYIQWQLSKLVFWRTVQALLSAAQYKRACAYASFREDMHVFGESNGH
jgi:hypothetical protein